MEERPRRAVDLLAAGGGGGGARAPGFTSRGGAGGLSLEAVEALEATACVARDDCAPGPGHPFGGPAVLVRGAVAAVALGTLLEGVQELGGIGGVAPRWFTR